MSDLKRYEFSVAWSEKNGNSGQVAHSGEYASDERAIHLLLEDPVSFVQSLMMREGIVSITYRLRQGDRDVVPETVKTKT